MTKTLTMAAILLFTISCNSDKTESAAETPTVADAAEAPAKAPAHEYAVKATYSSSFEIGDPKYADIVIDLWKQFDENTLDKGLDYFADTVDMWMADGWRFHGTRDSAMKMIKQVRAGFSEMKGVIAAITPLKSIDKDENWVIVYGTEYYTVKNKKDSSDIQENWRFDKNGKVAFMHSYRREIK